MAQPSSLQSVCVIGGCGFVGTRLLSMLRARYPSLALSCIDLRISKQLPAPSNVTYTSTDITDYPALLSALKSLKPQAIVHTASPAQVGKTAPQQGAAALYHKVNVEGTRNLLQAAQEVSSVKAFVFCSSGSVVHDTFSNLRCVDETAPVLYTEKTSPDAYSRSKALAERLVLQANGSVDENNPKRQLLTCAIRPVGVFGEGDVQNIPGILAVFRENKFQLGYNDNVVDFTHVDNVCHGLILGAESLLHEHAALPSPPDPEIKVQGEAFFITNDEPVYFWDYIRTVWVIAGLRPTETPWVIGPDTGMAIATILGWVYWAMGKPPRIDKKAWRYACMSRYFNVSKAKARLGWSPVVGLKEGLLNTLMDLQAKDAAKVET